MDEKSNHIYLSNLLITLLKTTGEKETEINKVAEELILKTCVEKYDPQKIAKTLYQTDKVPNWLPSLLSHPYGRKIIYSLRERFENDYFLDYSFNKIKEMGFTNKNYHLDINLKKLSNFKIFIDRYLNKISKSKRREDFIIDIIPTENLLALDNVIKTKEEKGVNLGLMSELEGFLSLATFSKSNFVISFKRITKERRNSRGIKGQWSVYKQLLTILTNSFSFQKDLKFLKCFKLVFPVFFKSVSAEGITSLSKLFSNDFTKKDVKVAAEMVDSKDSKPPSLIFQIAEVPTALVYFAFHERNGEISSTRMADENVRNCMSLYAFIEKSDQSYFSGENDKEEVLIGKEGKLEPEVEKLLSKLEKLDFLLTKKAFAVNIKKYFEELMELITDKALAKAVVLIIKCTILDTSFFNSTYHQVCFPKFIEVFRAVMEKHQSMEPTVYNITEKVFEMKLPTSFGAVESISLYQKVLDLCIFLVQKGFFKKVFLYLKSRMETMDYSLIRHFVKELSKSVSPPFSAEFLKGFCRFLVSDFVLEVVSADSECCKVIREFVKLIKEHKDMTGLHIEQWRKIESF